MNYKLGIRTDKKYKEVDLAKIFPNADTKKLKFIDEYTIKFENEEDLRNELIRKGLINYYDLFDSYGNICSIKIYYKYRGTLKNINVAYSDFENYLQPDYIYYSVKSMSNSISFLQTLADHYGYENNYNPQMANVVDIRMAIKNLKLGLPVSNQLDLALGDLCLKAMYTKDAKGEEKENYKGLRDLGYIVYRAKNVEALLKKKTEVIKSTEQKSAEQISIFENLDRGYQKKK